MEPLQGTSPDISTLQLEKLKEAFPEAVSEGKIDWEKLRLTLGEDLIIANERYVLNWAGKSDAFRAIQTPTTATLKPQSEPLMKNEDADVFDKKKKNQRDHLISEISGSDNIFIEGENLEVLKVLQKSYYGKVKMIYIDPPYNTGNDSFIYPDKFSESKEEYLKRIGDKDEAGYLTKEGLFRKNSKESGQYHSNWLSMMYPRLFLARNLLRDDGVIFVSIDDNEVHNLRLMMNEIFGEENFVANLIWEARSGKGGTIKYVSNQHEHILLFAKNFDQLVLKMNVVKKEGGNYEDDKGKYSREQLRQWGQGDRREDRPSMFYPIIHKGIEILPIRNDGTEGRWRFGKAKVIKMQVEGDLDFVQENGRWNVYRKIREGRESITATDSILRKVGTSAHGTIELKELFKGAKLFETTKPVGLLKYLIDLGIPEPDNDIILDFFAGSGTTAQAVLELNKEDLPASGQAGGGNRKFILVQLPEKTDEDSEAYKAGYKTIADICKERIRRVCKKIKEEAEKNAGLFAEKKFDLGFKAFALEPSNFKIWRTDTIDTEEDLKRQMEAFQDPVKKKSEAEAMAWEILLKSGYELTTPMEKIDVAGVPVYSISQGEVIVALEKITQEAIDAVIAKRPKRVVCLDKLFSGNDQLKTNTALQMKDAGVEFRTI